MWYNRNSASGLYSSEDKNTALDRYISNREIREMKAGAIESQLLVII